MQDFLLVLFFVGGYLSAKFLGFLGQEIYFATAFLMIGVVLQIIYMILKKQKIEKKHSLTFAVIIILGSITLILRNDIFIKLKPTILNALLAIVFLIFDFLGKENLTKKMFKSILVSEMMILANSIWAKQLSDNNLSGIFRVKTGYKPSFSSQVAEHNGIGAQYYGWFTSPLRRSADFINQAQLLSIINQTASIFNDDKQINYLVRDFENIYNNCSKTQKQLENYWTLIYLQQQKINQLTVTLIKDETATADDLPLTIKIADLPNQITPNSKMLVKISELEPEKEKITTQFVTLID